MSGKSATNVQNILLTGVAFAFGYAIYLAVTKAMDNRSSSVAAASGTSDYKCCCDGGISGWSNVPCSELTHYGNCRNCSRTARG